MAPVESSPAVPTIGSSLKSCSPNNNSGAAAFAEFASRVVWPKDVPKKYRYTLANLQPLFLDYDKDEDKSLKRKAQAVLDQYSGERAGAGATAVVVAAAGVDKPRVKRARKAFNGKDPVLVPTKKPEALLRKPCNLPARVGGEDTLDRARKAFYRDHPVLVPAKNPGVLFGTPSTFKANVEVQETLGRAWEAERNWQYDDGLVEEEEMVSLEEADKKHRFCTVKEVGDMFKWMDKQPDVMEPVVEMGPGQ